MPSRDCDSCTHNEVTSIARVENTSLQVINDEMLQPALIEEFENAFHTKMKELSAADNTSVADHERAIQTVTQQIEKIVDSIAVAGPLPSLTSRLKELEAKKESLLRNRPIQLSGLDVTLPRKNMTSAYKARIEHVQDRLSADPELKIGATGQLRTLVKTTGVHPLPENGRAAHAITLDINALAAVNQSHD